MLVVGQVRQLEKGDRRGSQKVLIRTMAVSINVDGVSRSFWMAGQVRHLKKGDQKVLIPKQICHEMWVAKVDHVGWQVR